MPRRRIAPPLLNVPPDLLCAACGHPAIDHYPELPSSCRHGRNEVLVAEIMANLSDDMIVRGHQLKPILDPESPHYGCRCIAFTPETPVTPVTPQKGVPSHAG